MSLVQNAPILKAWPWHESTLRALDNLRNVLECMFDVPRTRKNKVQGIYTNPTPPATTPVKVEKKHINKRTRSPTEPRVYVLTEPGPAAVLENTDPIEGRGTK
jgi:hypothetical protein